MSGLHSRDCKHGLIGYCEICAEEERAHDEAVSRPLARKFQRHDIVTHVKTGSRYVILLSPENRLMLEAIGAPAYAYQQVTGTTIWVRAAAEMEDGRFEFETTSRSAAIGRLPES